MFEKITKTLVENVTVPKDVKNPLLVRDLILPGFALRVTKTGVKSFVVEKNVNKRTCRATIGRYPQITVAQARKEAHRLLAEMSFGVDVNKAKLEKHTKSIQDLITLSQVLDDYIEARKSLKEGTIKDYRKVIKDAFGDYLNKPLLSINRDVVVKVHSEYGKRSHARANNAMRVLRALFNFAAEQYSDEQGNSAFALNPVQRLSNTKSWYKVDRRRTFIKPHELPKWFDAVLNLTNTNPNNNTEVIRDYLLLLIFTGLRRSEAMKIKVSDVDLEGRTLTVSDTKNSEPHVLPMGDYQFSVVKRRVEESYNDYLFPSKSKAGHLVDPIKQVRKVAEISGINFTLHDLRRTFATIAESLDIPYFALKKLLNHKTNQDVTAGYVVSDSSRLVEPMQRIERFILDAAGVIKNGGQ